MGHSALFFLQVEDDESSLYLFISYLKVFLYRLQEVQKGSRALFGEILEDRIYILIDTSQSMKDKLPVVKQKLFQLMRVSYDYFYRD